MSAQTVLILLLIGLVAGMLSGMVGIGGGIVIVPALIFFLAFSQKTAQGTSLGLLLLPAGILGAMQYYKQGHIDIKVVVVLAIGFILGNLFGSKIALSISDEKLKKVFAIFIMLVAIKMLFFDKTKPAKGLPSDSVTTETHITP
jgi:uncharacterized membrane protein YfcA